LNSQNDLSGRVALVTGSARRIGRQIALHLSQRGATVMLHGRSASDEADEAAATIRAAGGDCDVVFGDVADPDQAERIVRSTVERFGRLDILVNNAAIRRAVPLADLDYAEWRAVTAVILDGTFLCSRAAAPHLKASRRGRIVNIGGVTSHIGADSRSHVVAAKAGVVGLTKALAIELGPDDITVNCVAPGLIEDDGDDADHVAFRRRHTKPENIPLGRVGTPADVGKAIAALCGDEFSYLTGQTIHLNGGSYLW
jgi:3-oxoacyl-[acyl-carrier protein] reductase